MATRIWSERRAAALLASVVLAACSAATGGTAPGPVQPGAPGEASRPADVTPTSRAQRPYTEADVRFVQHMIAHHLQALEMAELVPDRTSSEDIRLLAQRIDVSQQDEIAMMERWLRTRGEPVPGPHAHHDAGVAGMPGMATPEELARLAAARGAEFDRLFLQLMIRHHQGALVMVDELFAQQGAGQDPEIYGIAEGVAGDQQIEIQRMQSLLAARQ